MLELLSNAGAGLASLRYNYEEIAVEHRQTVREAAVDIRQRTKRASEDILAIGQKLVEVKAMLPHGQFQDWVNAEFDLSLRTAQRLMGVAERFAGKSDTVTLLPTSVLYLLAAPSTPDEAVEAVVTQVQAGQVPTKAEVQSVIGEYKRFLTPRETEVAVWRAIKFSGVLGPLNQMAWMIDQPIASFEKVLMAGVKFDPPLLREAIESVRSQLQRQAGQAAIVAAATTPAAPQRAASPASVIGTPPSAVRVAEPPTTPPKPATPASVPIVVVESEVVEEPTNERNRRIDQMIERCRLLLVSLPEFEQITGCFSHAQKLRDALNMVAEDLERNRIQ